MEYRLIRLLGLRAMKFCIKLKQKSCAIINVSRLRVVLFMYKGEMEV